VEDAFADRTNGVALKRQFNIQINGVAVISHEETPHEGNPGNTFALFARAVNPANHLANFGQKPSRSSAR
jgi:hypothetical protein